MAGHEVIDQSLFTNQITPLGCNEGQPIVPRGGHFVGACEIHNKSQGYRNSSEYSSAIPHLQASNILLERYPMVKELARAHSPVINEQSKSSFSLIKEVS